MDQMVKDQILKSCRLKVIDELIASIDRSLLPESGAVFYSGRVAFSAPSPLYILGLNPGGNPQDQADDTIVKHTEMVLKEKDHWSAYQDEVWHKGHEKGKSGMQPRVLHLIKQLGFDPRTTPASNLVFVRSRLERDIAKSFDDTAKLCWPFHQAVIERLCVRVVLCFGQRAGNYVCRRLDAVKFVDEFIEENKRRWQSRAFRNANGIAVVVATHPSRADWTKTETDPTELVQRMLKRE